MAAVEDFASVQALAFDRFAIRPLPLSPACVDPRGASLGRRARATRRPFVAKAPQSAFYIAVRQVLQLSFISTIHPTRANPPKGGDAKLLVYRLDANDSRAAIDGRRTARRATSPSILFRFPARRPLLVFRPSVRRARCGHAR
jgi:hypothetical protein